MSKSKWQSVIYGFTAFTATLLPSTGLFAVTEPSEGLSQVAVFQAIDQMTSNLNDDLSDLAKKTNKTAIINYTQSEQLPASTLNYLTKRLEMQTQKDRSPVKFVQCLECVTLQAVSDGNDIILKKGIDSDQSLNQAMNHLGIKTYSEVNLAYAGDHLAMQMSVYDAQKQTTWAKEYRAPYRPQENWLAGVHLGAASHMKSGLDMNRFGRVYVGQRLHGVGSAGLSATVYDKHTVLGRITNLAGYFALSHNDIFSPILDGMTLNYLSELGVTDFNGSQQIMLGAGFGFLFGEVFSTQILARTHSFLQKPTDSRSLSNSNGDEIIRNDQPLPLQILLMTGIEFI